MGFRGRSYTASVPIRIGALERRGSYLSDEASGSPLRAIVALPAVKVQSEAAAREQHASSSSDRRDMVDGEDVVWERIVWWWLRVEAVEVVVEGDEAPELEEETWSGGYAQALTLPGIIGACLCNASSR